MWRHLEDRSSTLTGDMLVGHVVHEKRQQIIAKGFLYLVHKMLQTALGLCIIKCTFTTGETQTALAQKQT